MSPFLVNGRRLESENRTFLTRSTPAIDVSSHNHCRTPPSDQAPPTTRHAIPTATPIRGPKCVARIRDAKNSIPASPGVNIVAGRTHQRCVSERSPATLCATPQARITSPLMQKAIVESSVNSSAVCANGSRVKPQSGKMSTARIALEKRTACIRLFLLEISPIYSPISKSSRNTSLQ
jgi:hypothetical protein